ncbi:cyclic nucleotide-binding domain-containing protein [Desulfonatronospira sp.]|uniref:cyclic nucleotide-binding domain-containing protein n=1 Tax=Desulfonatronospira sp. TaxID=1962951 RepID=UPI0025C056C8|nr:cyclic nucleotide-binding domain-containing protein [Desulfonatronospira sp.]
MIDAQMLKKQILLQDMDEYELGKIAKIVQKVSIKQGEVLFQEEDETRGLWLINTGKIQISKMAADGWRQTLVVLGEGHFFGELAIVEKRKHVSKAEAMEDTELFLIPKESFEELVADDCALAMDFFKSMVVALSSNLRRMNDKFLSVLISY